jgi:hypothetical protein
VKLTSLIVQAAIAAASAGAAAGTALLVRDRKRRKNAGNLADRARATTVRIVREVGRKSRKQPSVRTLAGAAAGVAARAAGRAALFAIADVAARRGSPPTGGRRHTRSELAVAAGMKLGPDGTPGPIGI